MVSPRSGLHHPDSSPLLLNVSLLEIKIGRDTFASINFVHTQIYRIQFQTPASPGSLPSVGLYLRTPLLPPPSVEQPTVRNRHQDGGPHRETPGRGHVDLLKPLLMVKVSADP
jgi:hypothetical protein